jgi:crotonobetainyl-CoA:carnitine CoA-transferase CaiB-like acyl-CoA transferase
MKQPKTILALEQALALPYATQRFVHLGWRVIRVETPAEDGTNAGDPNRYIGADLGWNDLHSYYVAPNIGKEAITLNLKSAEGQQLLHRIIKELKVDVFMCNTLPKRYRQLGIDYDTLRQFNPDIIWCGISAMGPDYPDRAGYDPALQALTGFTYITGEPNGKPVPCGIPIIDLKAGDEAFTQVLYAMLDKDATREIHISMAQCAASWLITTLPQLNFVQHESELFQRSGNEHRSFIPCNVYPTTDGWVYLAIGNDIQWAKFTTQSEFASLASEKRRTNQGRMDEKENIYAEIGAVTQHFSTQTFYDFCLKLNLSAAPVNAVKDVAGLPFVESSALKTTLPDGRQAILSPPSYNTSFLKQNHQTLGCAPRLGADTEKVLSEAGLTETDVQTLRHQNLI